jgi:hypothetical protein
MIRGRLVLGRPVIEARIVMPRLRIAGSVTFLVDTGADISLSILKTLESLASTSVETLLIRSPSWSVASEGRQRSSRIRGLVFRHVDGQRDELLLHVGIAAPSGSNLGLPSLLGRDALKHYRFTFQETADLVILQSLGDL